jgi:hypothetical protein
VPASTTAKCYALRAQIEVRTDPAAVCPRGAGNTMLTPRRAAAASPGGPRSKLLDHQQPAPMRVQRGSRLGQITTGFLAIKSAYPTGYGTNRGSVRCLPPGSAPCALPRFRCAISARRDHTLAGSIGTSGSFNRRSSSSSLRAYSASVNLLSSRVNHVYPETDTGFGGGETMYWRLSWKLPQVGAMKGAAQRCSRCW